MLQYSSAVLSVADEWGGQRDVFGRSLHLVQVFGSPKMQATIVIATIHSTRYGSPHMPFASDLVFC